MKILPFFLPLAFIMSAAAGTNQPIRVVELVDFGTRPGWATPFGKATCHREFLQENGIDFVRFSYDAPKIWVWHLFGMQIPEGTTHLEFKWRKTDPNGKEGGCCISFCDAKGQNYQVGCKIPKGGAWGTTRADLGKPFNSWKDGGGKTDGQIHFPIRRISIDTGEKGSYDLAGIRAVTTADRSVLPDVFLVAKPDRKDAFWYPSETVAYDLALKPRTCDGALADRIVWRLTDYWNDACITSGVWRTGETRLLFAPSTFGRRFGSFRLSLAVGEGEGAVARDVWFARLTGPNPAPCGWVGTTISGSAASAAAMGIGVTITGNGWNRCERKKGEYDFGGIGGTITNLLSRGIRPHLMIHCENPLYENPLDPDAFAAFAGAYARHCARFGARDLEIFNEPCAKFVKQYGWADWTVKFVEFTHKARAAVKKAAPEMTVVTCAEDMDFRLIPMLTNSIATAEDAISIHPYCHEQPRPERGWFYKDNGAFVKRVAKKHCGTDNIRISEFGWTTYSGKGEYLEVAGHYPRASYAHQAQYIVRAYLIARMSGVEYSLQFRFDDEHRRDYTEHNFGFLFEDWTPKPSFSAVAFMTRLLGSAEPKGELSPQMDRYRIESFARGGRTILACWTVEGVVECSLPIGFGRVVRCYDLMGNEVATPLIGDGAIRLNERPIYIIGERE